MISPVCESIAECTVGEVSGTTPVGVGGRAHGLDTDVGTVYGTYAAVTSIVGMMSKGGGITVVLQLVKWMDLG